MSILIHLCRVCGHRAATHRPVDKESYVSCRCCNCRVPSDIDPQPTLIDTWTYPGHILEPLYRPGDTRNPGGAHREVVCDCEACQTRYAAETAI